MSTFNFAIPLLRQTLRRLARERSFTLTVLLTLALCIGANVAIFAVVDAILVRALPYPHADRLVTAFNSYPGAGKERSGTSLPNYYDRRERLAAFESTSIHQNGSAIVGPVGSPVRVARDRVSPEFFATLGVPLAMGRPFTEDQMLYANAQVLIITDEFWQTQFNGDANIIGHELMVDGLKNIVVGVLPPRFRFLDSKAKFFIPLASNLDDRGIRQRHSNNMQMIARLKAGVSVAEAQVQMNAFNETQLKDDPFADLLRDAHFHTNVVSLHADTVLAVRPTLLLLQAGALALLLIGGVNLVNLLLIRANGRAKEIAVRQALGAGRGHLARETVFSLIASALVGVALALPIIAYNIRRNLAPVLQAESRTGTTTRAAQNVRHGFIVVQIAAAFVLLCCAGLLGLSLKKILATSPGFQTDHVLTASISLPWKNYPQPAARQAFLERLLTELRAQPGVLHAGFTGGLPFGGDYSDNATTVEGVVRAPGESIRTHSIAFAMGNYWQALGIPLIEGRFLEDADIQREQRVCVVDQAFVQRYWPGQSGLGHRIANDVSITEENATTIVGVVGTVKQKDLTDTAPLGAFYVPYKVRPNIAFSIVIRTALPPESFGGTLQKLVLSLDPELPVDDIKVLQDRVDDSLVMRRSPAMLVGIFASVALLLAAIGTYGVLAYAVNQRRREVGVRMALGAQPKQVLQQFLGLGAKLLLAGISVGLVCAWLTGLLMRGMLYDVQAFHLGVAAATAAVMTVVVLLATLVPSQRAARVSPMEALHND